MTYLELTEQLCEDSMSARLAEFSAYYSNRMSYDEVAGLLERVTGACVLSDQTIQHLVVTKATQVSAQWQAEVQAAPDASALLEVMPQVDWYDAHSDKVLVLTDAIQVKQQKARREKGTGKPKEERVRTWVSTDVWLVERATGGFEYLTAGIAAPGEAVVSATARVRRQLQQDYGGREAPLPVVVISDGAKTIRCQLTELFAQPVPLILDWYHLEKKGLCRKIAFSRQNPKIVYRKINDLRDQTFLFTVICDRAGYRLADVLTQIASHGTDVAPAGTPQAADNGGNVRGNKHSKIYHLPGCPGFDAISPANIVAFASEAEAQQAGYRKARNCP